ncbi:MAG: glycosyltransferase [Deltaproteobacteria bacterium]|nr:glycosyltransferase [Deltaproteobacteria bacterium]
MELRPSGEICELNRVVSTVKKETGASSPSNPWAFFDKIYCISLEDRGDRRKEARVQFGNVGLADRVEFVIVKKHPADNEQGIHESHMICMRKGIHAAARTMIIFEDDIVFDRFSVKVLADCVRFLSTTSSWKLFFFGCLCSGSQRTENASVLKVRYRSLTHAYVVQRRFAETLLSTPWRNIPYDALLCTLAGDYYAAYPSFAFQSNSRTDNMRNRKVDRFRRLCGGLLIIQKMNERYHRNRLAVIGIHFFLIMLLLLLLARS